VDPTLTSSDYVNPDGRVNLEVIGWNTRTQGRWSLSATIEATEAAAMSQSAGGPAFTLRTDTRLDAASVPMAAMTGATPDVPVPG
jgi:hypothetical protein